MFFHTFCLHLIHHSAVQDCNQVAKKEARIIHKNASINLQSCPLNLATLNSLADNNKM